MSRSFLAYTLYLVYNIEATEEVSLTQLVGLEGYEKLPEGTIIRDVVERVALHVGHFNSQGKRPEPFVMEDVGETPRAAVQEAIGYCQRRGWEVEDLSDPKEMYLVFG